MTKNTHLEGKRLMILGCGYVGTRVAQLALESDMTVHALTRNEARAHEVESLGSDKVIVERLHETRWHGATDIHYDYVLNCVSSAGNGMEGYRQSYVDGMRSILEWARKQLLHMGTFVYTSSTGVYPQGDGEAVDESSPTEPASERASILLEAERILRYEMPCSRWFIMRLAGIYGEGRHYLLNALKQGESVLPGFGEHTLNLIYRDDAAQAILASFLSDDGLGNRIYNLSDNHHASKAALVQWLAAQLQVPVPTFDEVAGLRRVPNRKIISKRIQDELNWKPCYPSYQEGYAEILARMSMASP